MGKIRGWNIFTVDHNGNGEAWKNDRTVAGIVVWGSRNGKTLYSPRISKGTSNPRGIALKRGGFPKKEALDIVKDYMRSHPNG